MPVDREPSPLLWRGLLGGVVATQAAFVVLNLWAPGWRLVHLDREHNLPTWFHSALLTGVALVALDLFRLERRALRRSGERPGWALAWLAVAGGLGYLALDEMLVLHEAFFTAELRDWLGPASPLQLTLAWLLVFLPAIVGTVAFLLASLGARARLSPALIAWGTAGLGLWVLALTLEATTKSFFIPRNLYWLEVILEESAETLGTAAVGSGFLRYRAAVREWSRGATPRAAFVVPWRWVAAGTLALTVPAGVVGLSIAWNRPAQHRYLGDEHLRAGRVEEAVRAYRAAIAAAPGHGRAWYRLGIAELRRGDLAAAERALVTAERLDPLHPLVANDLGVVLSRQARHEEAVAAFRRAVGRDGDDPRAWRNLGAALHRAGRPAEARVALARAQALRPARLAVTGLRASVPSAGRLAYVDEPRLAEAMARTRAGDIEAAIAEYRRALARFPDLGPAHLGLANELVRWRMAGRLASAGEPAAAAGAGPVRARVRVRFEDWLRQAGGEWHAIAGLLLPPAAPVAPEQLARDARGHYGRAHALGVGAAARVGLGALARDEGDRAEAERQLAAARAADPSLPAALATGQGIEP